MAIFCSKCGKEHPDDANFCMKCGKPLNPSAQAAQPEPKWEYCEVSLEPTGSFWHKYHIEGRAVGARGAYVAARSSRGFDGYPSDNDYRGQVALNEVLGALAAQGWEPVGKGAKWWNYKYRRQVR